MKQITRGMIKLYNLDKWCFMGFKLDKNATYHHIIKKANGGPETIENGAVLNPVAHEYLHIIEYKDLETYEAINKILEIINRQKDKPTKEQYEIINYLLTQFEKEFKGEKTSKGKTLIKPKYLERGFRK